MRASIAPGPNRSEPAIYASGKRLAELRHLVGVLCCHKQDSSTANEAGEGMVKLFHHTDNAGGAAINKSGVLKVQKRQVLEAVEDGEMSILRLSRN